jgi:hypothetical protein
MSAGPHSFKQSDVTRAFVAAQKAGEKVRVEIDLQHKRITLTPMKPDEAVSETNGSEHEKDLDQWIAKHAREAEGH